MTDFSENLPFSAACERNKNVILQTISPYLSKVSTILEVGSGTAQHAVYFCRQFPGLIWQTSDQQSYLDGILAQLKHANLENVLKPIELDVNQDVWVVDEQKFDLIYTANTFHIMSQEDVVAFFSKLSTVATATAYLIVYGPFKYKGQFTSQSNHIFDISLRSRNCGSAIRGFEVINHLAEQQGFYLLEDKNMPANNQCLIWQRK